MPLAPNTKLDHYEIISPLGIGGMGEVYRARDLRLGRFVALKLLLPQFTASTEHLRRFEIEAKAISALNHPNILTIYEIGQFGSEHYIVTEFVEGHTLRQLMKNGAVEVEEIVAIVIQIARGLAAAHTAGIVHRDIKPENVIVRNDGYVKVLDFGLAKLFDSFNETLGLPNESTISNVKTVSGTILGTVSYMSPEQLRGQLVDARTDLWSLGAVMYELLTNRPPFTGVSAADVTVAILERDPPPIVVSRPGYPILLPAIVMRLLAKQREHRFQSANDLLAELHRLRLTSGTGEEQNVGLLSTIERRQSGGRVRDTKQVDTTTDRREANPSLSWPFGVSSRSRLLTAILLIVFASLAAVWLRQVAKRKPPANTVGAAPAIAIKMLIDTGNVSDVSISPDDKYVVYALRDGERQGLWLMQLASGRKLEIMPAAPVTYLGTTFSPDSNYVYSVAIENNKNYGVLYETPVLGGGSRRVMDDLDSPISFSPDGQRFVFVRGYPSLKETALFTANRDGTGQRKLATRKSPDDFGWQGGPAWSPDGQIIACASGAYDLNMKVDFIRVSDGTTSAVLGKGWPWIGRVIWLNDGKAFIMSAKDQDSPQMQLWHVSYPSGELRRITNDLNTYSPRGIGVSANSTHLVAVQTSYHSKIWIVPQADAYRARQLTYGMSDGFSGLSWTPDNRIVYASNTGGSQNIWIMNNDGSEQRKLTDGNYLNYHPSVTSDGRYILFISNRAGSPDVWRMGIGGEDPAKLTSGRIATWPRPSPDNQWVVFKSFAMGRRTLWKTSIDGGEPIQLTEAYTGWPAVSPDGTAIACEYWNDDLSAPIKLAVIPFDGGLPAKIFEPSTTLPKQLSTVIQWVADERGITYITNRAGVSNIASQPLNAAPPKQLTRFQSDQIFWFDWSLDGENLACARGVTTSGVVMISNFTAP